MLAALLKKRAERKNNPCNNDSSKFRLKKPIVNHCLLCFKPDLEEYTFEGSEIFQMELVGDTREIMVNAVDLIITKAIFEEDVTLNRQEPLEIRVEDRTLKLVFEPELVPQKGCLRLNFKGNMSDKLLRGLYVYDPRPPKMMEKVDEANKDLEKEKKLLNMMTFFEPCEARRCYPCWDDPNVKISYDLILVVPKGSVVIGPTSIKATYDHRRNPLLEVAEFKQTPKLSPHTLGFTYGSFDYLEGKTADEEILLRIYTPKGKQVQAEFALSLVSKAVPFLQTYFGVPLNCQKLDLVALPDNVITPSSCYGLIFYRASDLLMEDETALLDMMWISLIIVHELTKQWFGCLATFDWWSHQWLKEGMASFAKYTFVHHIFPEMDVWSHFLTNTYQRALKSDGTHLSRPVESQVQTIPEIEEALDDSCLYKSPSLLRMIHRFVGDALFRKGLQQFLLKYKFANATTTDFWKCMQEASSKPLSSMMTNWSTVRGYPLLTVTIKQETRAWSVKITQERFVLDPSHRDPKGQSPVFSIPLSFCTRLRPTESVLDIVMDTKVITVTIPEVGKTDWIKVNPGAIGFYRVKYPHDMISTLTYAIREKQLAALDRLDILDDSFAFLLAGYETTAELSSLLEAYSEDDDYTVWVTMSNIFDRCIRVFEHVGKAESFKQYGRYVYQQIHHKLGWMGWDEEPINQKLLRPLVIRMMAKFNNVEVIEKCKILYEGQFDPDEPMAIPVDFKYAVYKTVLANGDDSMVKRFIKLYRECEPGDEKDKLAAALGGVTYQATIMHVLEFSISAEVRRAHTIMMITGVAKTKLGKELAWNFVKDYFVLFRNNYSARGAGKLFQAILEDFATEERIKEIEEFFKLNPFPGTEKTIQKITNSIRINELWLKREKNLTALQDFLESTH